MAGIPTGQPRIGHFLILPGLVDLLIIAFSSIVGATTIIVLYDTNHKRLGLVAIIASVGVLVLVIVRIVMLFKAEGLPESTHAFEGCLHTLHAIIIQGSDQKFPGVKVRGTIHRPIQKGTEQRLLQVMEYVGDNRSDGRASGRDFAVQSGVIGEAYRTFNISFGDRKNDDDAAFVDELVREWAYTRKDAEKLDKQAKSWLAIPLTRFDVKANKKIVEGIVYFDATTRGFFTDERKAIAVAACQGIALFVVQRYT